MIYEKGILVRGLSRGDGIIGEDITENLKTISSIPKTINEQNIPKLIEIRCEIFIGKKDFSKLKDRIRKPQKCCWWIFKTKRPERYSKNPAQIFCLWIWSC